MVKLKRNKSKQLNKLIKKQETGNLTNKIIKKRVNAEKKLNFQKQTLLHDAVKTNSSLVQEVYIQKKLTKSKPETTKSANKVDTQKPPSKKQKHVQKQKQRRKTSVNDVKLLIKLMNSK